MKWLLLTTLIVFSRTSWSQTSSLSKSSDSATHPTVKDQLNKCEQGAMPVCFTLAMMYADGVTVDQDKNRAISLFKKVCDSKQEIACVYAAELTKDPSISEASCNRGNGVACFVTDLIRESTDHALTKKSCELKYGPGCTVIGEDIESTDKNASTKFYEAACDLQDGAGCYRLGSVLATQGLNEKSKNAYDKACRLGFPAPTCLNAQRSAN